MKASRSSGKCFVQVGKETMVIPNGPFRNLLLWTGLALLPALNTCSPASVSPPLDTTAIPLPVESSMPQDIPPSPTIYIHPPETGILEVPPESTHTGLPDAIPEQDRSVLPDPDVCSPLEAIPLVALVEIISNPYQASRLGKDDGHPALDFAFYNWRGLRDIDGHPVHSVLAGRVVALGFDRLPYGNMVIIETVWENVPGDARTRLGIRPDQSLYVLYAHLKEPPTLAIGETVACGQQVGSAGQTGRSGAPHLHLELRAGPADTRFTQMVFYDTQARDEEMAQYRLWSMSGEFASLGPLVILSTAAEP